MYWAGTSSTDAAIWIGVSGVGKLERNQYKAAIKAQAAVASVKDTNAILLIVISAVSSNEVRLRETHGCRLCSLCSGCDVS